MRDDPLVPNGHGFVRADHDGDTRSVDVGIEEANARPRLRQRAGEVDGHRRLAHPALAAAHRDDVAYIGHRRLVQARMSSDLCCHGHLGLPHARQSEYQLSGLILHLVLYRTGRRREVDLKTHRCILDLDVPHEPQRDDVPMEVGILDPAEGLQDVLLADARLGHAYSSLDLDTMLTPEHGLPHQAPRCSHRFSTASPPHYESRARPRVACARSPPARSSWSACSPRRRRPAESAPRHPRCPRARRRRRRPEWPGGFAPGLPRPAPKAPLARSSDCQSSLHALARVRRHQEHPRPSSPQGSGAPASSAVLNEWPQPQVDTALGLLTVNPWPMTELT